MTGRTTRLAVFAAALAGAAATDASAQVEAGDTIGSNVVVTFAFGAGTPDLPHVGAIDLEFRDPDRRLFPSLGVASPGDFTLLGLSLNHAAWARPPDAPAAGFLGLGPTFEFGSDGVRLAAAARAATEYRISRGLWLRLEGRGLLFVAGDGAGDTAILGLVGLSAGGQR